MSEPSSPKDSPGHTGPRAGDDAAETGPIDVYELLESTRKLFTVDEEADSAGQSDSSPPEASAFDPATGESALESDRLEVEPDTESAPGAEDHREDEDTSETPSRSGFNVLAIASVVLAIALSPVAVIFGYIALGQTRRAHQRGEAIALWGIGLGWVVLAAWVVGVGSLWWIASQEGITFDSLSELVEFLRIP